MLKRQQGAARSVFGPVREHESRQTDVADVVAVRTAVRQAVDGVAMLHQLMNVVEVFVRIIKTRIINNRATVLLEHQVVHHFERDFVALFRQCSDALARIRFVVWPFSHAIHFMKATKECLSTTIDQIALLGQNALANCRIL